ncbi:MAG: DUF3822 family protein [Prevotella sp.]|nr:DUF3822 family protein [Prevotella sp.]
MNENNIITDARLVIRVSRHSLAFAVSNPIAVSKVEFEPYTVRSGISMAANLREAFRESTLLGRGYQRAQALIDTPVLMVPIQEFDESSIEDLYHHAMPGQQGVEVAYQVLPELKAVALYSINRDLKLVMTDHFNDVRFLPLMQPIWQLHLKRSYTGMSRKLYGHFHDRTLEIFSFEKNRFRFCNTFDTNRVNDAVYFLLYVWKQLALDNMNDELHLSGDLPEREMLIEQLRRFVKKVYILNPTAEFNRTPVSLIKGMPLDLVTLFAHK